MKQLDSIEISIFNLMHCLTNFIADTFKLLYKPFVEVWIKRHTLGVKPIDIDYSSLSIVSNSTPPVIAHTYSKTVISVKLASKIMKLCLLWKTFISGT